EILDVNAAFTRITGYTREEVLGKNPSILKSGKHDPEFYEDLWRSLIEQGNWSGEIWNRRKNGEIYPESLTISAVRSPDGQVQRYVALFSDIRAQKEHQSQLEHVAHYDALTGLPNRVLLDDRLRQAMLQASRRDTQLALVYLDLDGFKEVNDDYGHDVGDRLLVTLADRMNNAVREVDTLARLGGDEFVALLADLPDVDTTLPWLKRLLNAIAEPVNDEVGMLQVSASLGVSFYPQAEPIDADQLLRQADQAMYQAKLAGKNRYHLFDAAQDRDLRGQHESVERIRVALEAHEFTLHYQPKVDMRRGRVIGVEALIRWQHPEEGLLYPDSFLPIISNHPLMLELGDWVIESALQQIVVWRTAGISLPVSVNVDAMQLDQADFIDKLGTALARHPQVESGDLELEILATSALEDINRVSQVMQDVQSLGVGFALDDFGTGYSSLTYLKRLPIQTLKIDQSFVRDMLDDPEDLTILDGTLSLAISFRRQVIAEGVESEAHGELLLQLGCELGQGYAIARPMPAAQIPA
ncbi:MAG: EAL domain-containing protein, partial [Candidatus Thiodiazotropha taylori]|nr:EAL domain-containing protein [Candidatus Thiodiazotropha taylori]MCW4253555.1 EAL domain-containing protein [Candidatus Thiodiazotropha taylori]